MSFDEIAAIVNAVTEKTKSEWEKIRHICFYMVAPHTKDIDTPQDLYRFDWEKRNKEVDDRTKGILKRKAKKLEQWLNGNSQ